ncbi:PspC domain-containing protein [Microbacterium sp. Se5.02b]|uniref:PspC domain-containing protein n=1 Tax=Microbacterium sp. Se5.02b TaxID=2864103 RepID=UPI00160512BA|nr:PspC domain-containing protein [Microbacterium sp. Se5.02b]QNA93475.1 PspC domain-containing protein [Microbacterium sp. Se63.02b]QYM63719.1 PspC domain-containing protein [Microbacterium sp. Se5.02b]
MAAGIAARLRIDPLIVRGVLVVAALFGLPVIFLYAAAWALLPDVDGRVHVRDLLRRDYQPVQWGILAMAVIGLFPTAPLAGRLFGLGYDGWSALSFLSWIVGLVLVAVLLFLIVRAASRTPGASAPDLPMASADQAAPAASVPLGDSGVAERADATLPYGAYTVAGEPVAEPSAGGTDADADDAGSPSVSRDDTIPDVPPAPFTAATPPAPPAPLPPGSHDPAALDAWRAQHAAWREQDQAWRRQQQDVERAARDQLRRERQAEAAVFAAEATERRRIRRASNPRAGFAFTATMIGLAIITGAAVGLGAGADTVGGALGLLAAALILALGMVVAGAFRRRSGFLAFTTVVTLVGGLIAGGFAAFPGLTLANSVVMGNDGPAHIRQPFGDVFLTLSPSGEAAEPIVFDKGTGTVYIFVQPGVELDLRATVDTATARWTRVDATNEEILGHGTWPARAQDGGSVISEKITADGAPVTTVQRVTIHQTSGEIAVTVVEPEKEDQR